LTDSRWRAVFADVSVDVLTENGYRAAPRPDDFGLMNVMVAL